MAVQNIIFDLGGVILNIDYQLTIDAFKKLGIRDFDRLFSQLSQTSIFDDFETGRMDTATFMDRMKAQLPGLITPSEIVDAWNSMLLDLPAERLELLSQLRSRFRLFLLSNTNELHIATFHKNLQKEHGLPDLSHLFEKMYFSYLTGVRKPDVKIFEMVIRDNGLKPEETLFIDDSAQHIEGAGKAGLLTHHLTKGETIIDYFRDGVN